MAGEKKCIHFFMKGIMTWNGVKSKGLNLFYSWFFLQVKEYNAFRGEYNAEAFTFNNVAKKVLGQHGIKLVMEANESYFFPYVVGLLCIGTKVSI